MLFFLKLKAGALLCHIRRRCLILREMRSNHTMLSLIGRPERKSTRRHTTTPWERNLQETTKASAVIQRCSTPKLEQPAASLDRNHSSSIMSLSSSCRTHIVVDLPAATAKQCQILTLEDTTTAWGPRHTHRLTTQKQNHLKATLRRWTLLRQDLLSRHGLKINLATTGITTAPQTPTQS